VCVSLVYIHVQCSVTHCNTLQQLLYESVVQESAPERLCVAVCCSMLQYVAVSAHKGECTRETMCCSVLPCVAVCCSVLQCVAVCCSECVKRRVHAKDYMLQCVAVCCSMKQQICVKESARERQRVAVRCSMFQCVFQRVCQKGERTRERMCCSTLQCVAVCCSVLQCVAVCCNALHYVALSVCKERARKTARTHMRARESPKWRLPGGKKNRVWPQKKSEFGIARQFSICRLPKNAQTKISVSSTFWH